VEAEAEAEVVADQIPAGYMQDNTSGLIVGTMRMAQTTGQIDLEAVVAEVANRIGVEAEASGVTITIRIQAEEMYRITMAATIKARCNHNVNNIITNTADCLSQIAPWVPQQYHLIAIIKLRPERLRHKAM